MMSETSVSFDLVFNFPKGKAWAAIKEGNLVDLIYWHACELHEAFPVYRQRSRGELAKKGKVVSGEVVGTRFVMREK
jgi:hypothetical protein